MPYFNVIEQNFNLNNLTEYICIYIISLNNAENVI